MDELVSLPLDRIVEPRLMLRLVNKDTVEYMELRDSIAQRGFLNSVSVRPSQREPGKFEIVDGMYRFTVARELGLPSLPCIVKHDVADDDVLVAQIQGNAVRVETQPAQFAHQLKRILTRRPEMTFAELAVLVKKSPSWVARMLGLLFLRKEIQQAMDRGEIPMQNAYMLSKLPPRLQGDYVDQAKVMPTRDFKALAAAVVKQFKEAVRQGKLDRHFLPKSEPVAYLRPLKHVLDELEERECGGLMVAAEGCKSPLDGWYAALRWAVHFDRESLHEQEAFAARRSEKRLRKYLENHDEVDPS